jgi:hypothetical protein
MLWYVEFFLIWSNSTRQPCLLVIVGHMKDRIVLYKNMASKWIKSRTIGNGEYVPSRYVLVHSWEEEESDWPD